MSVDLVVSASVASGTEIAGDVAPKDAKLRMQHSLVFLDGRKLKPLRSLEHISFDGLEVTLSWPGGPSMRLVFPDEGTLHTFRVAVESAQARAAKSACEPQHAPAVQLSKDSAGAMTPPSHAERKRPLLDSGGSAAKRRLPGSLGGRVLLTARASARAEKAMDADVDVAPAPPRVDAALTEEERARRRGLAADSAHTRVEREQLRGIGDAALAQRMQERAEREGLIGRIKERNELLKKEIAWNIGTATIAELRAHLNSSVGTRGA